MKTLALDEAASASRARRVLVECPGCGLVMELMKLPRHQKEECENRKVLMNPLNIHLFVPICWSFTHVYVPILFLCLCATFVIH